MKSSLRQIPSWPRPPRLCARAPPLSSRTCGSDGLIDPEAVAAAVTPRTAAIMPVHLWGGICDMEALWSIAERHGLAIVEDAAQAMGTRHRNRRAGSLGTVGCFSAHPLKIFNALGDAGFITTDSDEIAARTAAVEQSRSRRPRYRCRIWLCLSA